MATVTPTTTHIIGRNGSHTKIIWAGMVTGDTIIATTADVFVGTATVHTYGTWNGGTTVTLTGGFDGTNYDVLPDHDGNALSKTANGIDNLGCGATHYLPTIASGSADSVTLVLCIWHT